VSAPEVSVFSKTPAELEQALRARLGPGYCAELDELVRRTQAAFHNQRGLRAKARARAIPTAQRKAEQTRVGEELADLSRKGTFWTQAHAIRVIAARTGWPKKRVRGYVENINRAPTRVGAHHR
jgi:hypothetical protein